MVLPSALRGTAAWPGTHQDGAEERSAAGHADYLRGVQDMQKACLDLLVLMAAEGSARQSAGHLSLSTAVAAVARIRFGDTRRQYGGAADGGGAVPHMDPREGHIRALAMLMSPSSEVSGNVGEYLRVGEYGLALAELAAEIMDHA